MTELIEETFPGMPDLPKLWAVHVQGQDDIVAVRNRDEADELSLALDELDEKNAGREHMPRYSAVVIEWPGTREDHAQALIDNEE